MPTASTRTCTSLGAGSSMGCCARRNWCGAVNSATSTPHCKIALSMRNFRQFEAGPDPFGRQFQVYFKWLQTAISIRHLDTVDVEFILDDEAGGKTYKTLKLTYTELHSLSRETGREMDDPWCARLAAEHLVYLINTGEDIEKALVTVGPADLKRHAAKLAREEQALARA